MIIYKLQRFLQFSRRIPLHTQEDAGEISLDELEGITETWLHEGVIRWLTMETTGYTPEN